MIKEMDMESTLGQTEVATKESGKKASNMVRVCTLQVREMNNTDCGRKEMRILNRSECMIFFLKQSFLDQFHHKFKDLRCR